MMNLKGVKFGKEDNSKGLENAIFRWEERDFYILYKQLSKITYL